MNGTSVPAAAVTSAEQGRWRDAWTLIAGDWSRLLAGHDAATLFWLYELCLRLGFDVRRRLVARTLARHHAAHPGWLPLRVVELVRRGRLVDAWHAARTELPPEADDHQRTAWWLAQSRVCHELRDHDAAARWLDRARERDPWSPQLAVDQAWAHLAADRVDAALATCDEALARRPEQPCVLLTRCWIHHDANRPGLDELVAATRERVQSPLLDSLLANHRYEHGDLAGACALWERLVAEPMHERRTRRGWLWGLVHANRERGDDARALHWATQLGPPGATACERLRAHLATPTTTPTRVVLPVPFVRQDYMTCSPATMAALLASFGEQVDQREIAARITYDGTSSHDEMVWARERGLVVRFFQFDADTARSLIDRGLPFAITTRFETNSHRQAVVGYDRLLDTFLLRDPTGNYRREVTARWLAELTRRGGDCALLLPAAVAARVTLPALPAEAETMAWLQLRLLHEERRMGEFDRGVAALLPTLSGPLRLDVLARVSRERDDRRTSLQLWRDAQTADPDDAYWQYHCVAELLSQNCWQEARTLLERWVPRSRSPFLMRMLADQWRHDARTRPAAAALMRRALRWLGRDGRSWQQYASLVWDQERRAEATDLYFVATTLSPHDEWLAGTYWRARQQRGEVEAGLAFLRARVASFGARSAAPAGTLADALESLHRIDEAILVLQTALHADDTPAERTRLANLLLRHHRHDDVRALLADHERFTAIDHALLRHALARATGDRPGVRAALQAAVAAAPAHVEAWEQLLEDLLAGDGLVAAREAADRLVREQPDHPALLAMVARFHQRVDDHAKAEELLRRLVQEHPNEAWLRGRLARHLLARGQTDAAAPLVAELLHSVPNSGAVWSDKAELEHARGDLAAARAAAARALELAPDDEQPLRLLLNLAGSRAEAATALRLVMRSLAERPVPPTVDTLLHVLRLAGPLDDGELDRWLQDLAVRFPATSAADVARCEAHVDDDPAAALAIAQALVAREAWHTPHHLRLARCLRAQNRRNEERAALEVLLQQDPGCVQAHVEIGESFDQEGRLPQALAAFDRGLAQSPGHATLHGMVADAAWRLGDAERALAAATRAGELDPSYAWSFHARVVWLAELGRTEAAVALTTTLVRDNPRWGPAHDLHATALANAGRHEERLVALQRALELSPRLGTTRLRLIDALLQLKRYDEAQQVVAAGKLLLGDMPELALRDVTLLRQRGDLDASRQALRDLLARHPDFGTGWRRLLAWYDEERRDADLLALYRDPPPALHDDPTLDGHAADVLRRRGDDAAAVAAFEAALAKDQGYTWARESLCDVLLKRGEHSKVLALLPDHEHPERLPWAQAVLVGTACARLGRRDTARAALVRLLTDPSGQGMDVATLDEELRRQPAPDHDAFLATHVGTRCVNVTTWVNWLRILGRRRADREFWRGVDIAHDAIGADGDLLPLVRAIVDVSRDHKLEGLAPWARRHLRPPITDIRLVGQLMYLLCGERPEQEELLRLFADHWRRPDIEGWMLANLSSAMVDLGRLDEAEQVVRFALESIPHDHSFWWFQRDRAEIALRRRQWAACSAAFRDPPAEYPTVRLSMWQIDLCATLRQLPWWRRPGVLRDRLRRSFALRDAALLEPRALGDLRAKDLFRAYPSPTTALLLGGRVGRWFVRRVLLRA